MTDDIDWKSRRAKRATSALMFRTLSSTWDAAVPARNAIFLPGPECLCIMEALQAGIVSRKTTRIIAAEDRPVLFPAMCDKLESLGFRRQPRMLRGEIETSGMDEIPEGVDFAYLDFCGHIDTGIARWMHDVLSPRLSVGARVAITMTCDGQYRSNEMMKRTRVHFDETPPAAVADVQARVPLVNVSREMRAEQALGICLVLCTLRRWNVEVSAFAPYSDDHRRMSKAVFRVVSPSPEEWWPGIEDVIAYTDWLDFKQFISLEGRRKMSHAGLRGVVNSRLRHARLRDIDNELALLNEKADRLRRERNEMIHGQHSNWGAGDVRARIHPGAQA